MYTMKAVLDIQTSSYTFTLSLPYLIFTHLSNKGIPIMETLLRKALWATKYSFYMVNSMCMNRRFFAILSHLNPKLMCLGLPHPISIEHEKQIMRSFFKMLIEPKQSFTLFKIDAVWLRHRNLDVKSSLNKIHQPYSRGVVCVLTFNCK